MLFRLLPILLLTILTGCGFLQSEEEEAGCQLIVTGDNEYCAFFRPCEITPISKQNVPHEGFHNWVKLNTADSLLPYIDSTFFDFEVNEYGGHLPLKYPYYLKYSPILGYFQLRDAACEFTSLPQQDSIFTFDEIFQVAISDDHLFMVTYDDDLSFMDPKKLGIKHYVMDIDMTRATYYEDRDQFLQAIDSISGTSVKNLFEDDYFGPEDFVEWYGSFTF